MIVMALAQPMGLAHVSGVPVEEAVQFLGYLWPLVVLVVGKVVAGIAGAIARHRRNAEHGHQIPCGPEPADQVEAGYLARRKSTGWDN